jgi:tRNA (guanine37-N1)-methyltransferase
MIARALVVPRARGEEVRRSLLELGALRTDLAIVRDAGTLAFPLQPGAAVPPGWGKVEERTFSPHPSRGPADYRALLAWPAELSASLPRSFDVIGEIVLVRIPPALEARREEIGEALLGFVPGARIVGWDRGVHGPERRRTIERLAGSGGWTTRHRENRLELDVDVERAYFSPRLSREHALVAEAVRSGERVYDLACGVGPFALTIARGGRAREIVAVDANPAAIELLRATAARYPFASRIRAVDARLEAFVGSAEPFERAVFNLPREGIKYAPLVARAVAPGGRLHYYEVVPRAGASGRAELIASTLPPSSAWRPVETHAVHPYSPSADLVAFLFERGPA